ncbi:DUF433 domain-containing protein [Aurantimonas marina]|uniref:DUF433 domain-containing protein n=1 Tax=Aurantimonas marina TaxID=2780508 RepID=UPI0019D2C71F|nr:DUF433 domain-containing protein [Aurantimonas marina]
MNGEEASAMNASEILSRDPDVMSGALVFKGTRVPVDALFENLAASMALAEFLENFPTVSREQAEGALRHATELVKRGFVPRPELSEGERRHHEVQPSGRPRYNSRSSA